MLKYLLVIMLSCCLLQGCGGRWSHINVNDVTYFKGDENRKCDKKYQLGVKTTSSIGQEMFRYRMCEPQIYIKEVSSPNELKINAKRQFTEFYVQNEKDKKYEISNSVVFDKTSWQTNVGNVYHLVRLGGSNGQDWGLLMGPDGRIFNYGMYDYASEMMYCSVIMKTTPDDFAFDVHTGIKDFPKETYEFIFSGKNDVSMNTTYREFSAEDLARPAFFQNLTYQANAKQIRFKEFLIQIHDVTNESITYTIIEDGTKTD